MFVAADFPPRSQRNNVYKGHNIIEKNATAIQAIRLMVYPTSSIPAPGPTYASALPVNNTSAASVQTIRIAISL